MGCTLKSTPPNNLCLCAFLALPRLVNGMQEIATLYKWRFLQSVIALGRVIGNNDLCVSCKFNLCLCECVVKRKGKTDHTTAHKQLQPQLILAKLGVTYSFCNWIPSIPIPAFHDSNAFRKETSYQNHWVLTCVDIHPSISPQKSFHETNRTNVPIQESSRPFCFQFTNLRVESKGHVPHWLQTLRGKFRQSPLGGRNASY